MMRRFMAEIAKSGTGLSTYGEAAVRKALETGAVDTLLISETLRKLRVEFTCPNDGEKREVTVAAGAEPPAQACPKCGTNMGRTKETDLIRDLADKAERYGTKVALISVESDDGKMFLAAFGGLGAILRFVV
jgi:peptide chain release factor subunit 1